MLATEHLQGFSGSPHGHAFSDSHRLYGEPHAPRPITEIACWAHARRRFHDVMRTTTASLAVEAIERIIKVQEIEARRERPATGIGSAY